MDKTAVWLGIISIVAIIVGPMAALWVQRLLDEGREERNRKMWIFKTLMSFRATPLSPTFVQALNLIDIEFNGNDEKEKRVRNKWKVLLDHFADLMAPNLPDNSRQLSVEKTVDLLIAMGTCLGYEFDEVQIKKGVYYPQGLGDVEQEQHKLRRYILELLEGNRRIPVGVFEDAFPAITPPIGSNLEAPGDRKSLSASGEVPPRGLPPTKRQP